MAGSNPTTTVSLKMSLDAASVKTEAQAAGQALEDMARRGSTAAEQTTQRLQGTEGAAGKMGNALGEAGKLGQRALADLARQATGVSAPIATAGTRMAALAGPIGLLVAGVGVLGKAWLDGARESREFEKALLLSGNAAGTTAGQMADMARNISAGVGTQAQAAQVLAQLAAGGQVAAGGMQQLAQAAIAAERSLGVAIDQTVANYERLAASPVAASLRLNEQMHHLTASTYDQLRAAEALGDKEQAAAIAQDAYGRALAGRAGEMEKHLGVMERAWRAVGDAAKWAWDKILNVGRASTAEQQLASARASVDALEKTLASREQRGLATGDVTPRLEAARNLVRTLEDTATQTAVNTAAQTEQNKATSAYIELGQLRSKHLSDQEQMQQKVVQATRVYEAALQDQTLTAEQRNQAERDYLAIVGDITKGKATRERAAKAESSAGAGEVARIRAMVAEQERYAQALQDSGAAAEKATAGEKLVARLQEELQTGIKGTARANTEAALAEAQRLVAAEKVVAGLKHRLDAEAELDKAQQKARDADLKRVEAYARQVDQIAVGNDKLRDEIATLGLSREQQTRYAQAKLDSAIAIKQEQLARMQGGYTQTREMAALEDEIRLLQERRELLGQRAERELDIEGAKAIEKTEKATEQMGQALADNLMRGGKSAKQYLIDIFRTTVLRPILAPVMGGLMGAFGMAGSAAAGQGGGGGSGGLGNVAGSALNLAGGSIFGAGGLSGAMMGGAGWLTGATTFGGALGAAGSLIGTGTLGGIASGLAMGVGAIAPIILPIALGWDKLFGRSLEDVGVQGTFGGDKGFAGSSYQFYEGGLFRSDKTDVTPLPDEIARPMGEAWKAIVEQVTDYADILQLDAKRIEGFTSSFKLSLGNTGLEGDALSKAIGEKLNEALKTSSNELAQQLIGSWQTTTETVRRTVRADGGWDSGDGAYKTVDETVERQTYVASEYARAGEQAIDTLARLATSLSGANALFDTLGLQMYEASLAGGDMASQLADAAGGLDKLQAQSASYFQNFYTGSEQFATALRQVKAQFDDLDVAMPASRAEFRRLVESLDLTTESGRATFAQLMTVSEAFAQVTPQLFQAGGELASAITQGLLGTYDGEGLGAYMAQTVQDGIYNAIAGQFGEQITQIIMAGVIDPVIQAAITGSSVSAAVSQASIAEMLAQATAVAEAAAVVLNDPAFKEAMAAIGKAVADIAVPVQRAAPRVASYTRAVSDSGAAAQKAASDTERAAEQIRRAWAGIADSLIEEARRIRGELATDAGQGLAYWQAQLAITQAQALAGDQDAAAALPGIARSLQDAARQNAGSRLELAQITAQTASALESVAAYAQQKAAAPAQAATPQWGGGLGLPGGNMAGWGGLGGFGGDLSGLLTTGLGSAGGNMAGLGGAPIAPIAPPPLMAPPASATAAPVVLSADPGLRADVQELTSQLRIMKEQLLAQGKLLETQQRDLNRVMSRWDATGMPPVRVAVMP